MEMKVGRLSVCKEENECYQKKKKVTDVGFNGHVK